MQGKCNKSRVRRKGINFLLFMPPHIRSFLSYYSFANKTTNTSIITKLLEDWMSDYKRIDFTGNSLLQASITRCQMLWKIKKGSDPNADFSEFRKKMYRTLRGMGLTLSSVNKILAHTHYLK